MFCFSACLHRCSVKILSSPNSPCPSVFFLPFFFSFFSHSFLLVSQLGLFLIPCPPAGSHLKTQLPVCLAHLCWFCLGWLSSVSALTYKPTVGGCISQNAWFGVSFNWNLIMFGKALSKEEDFFHLFYFFGTRSLLAVLQSFLAHKFVYILYVLLSFFPHSSSFLHYNVWTWVEYKCRDLIESCASEVWFTQYQLDCS